ncbi:MAG: hypothetical protein PVF58_20560 [Candidatus Methanofastidiosia archaeon]|jgi:hypothetical protein
MEKYAKKLGIFLEKYIITRSILFLREDPRIFALRHFKIFSILSLSSNGKIEKKGLKEKLFYSLWNNVIDDIIEYTHKGKDNIFDSLQVVAKYRNGMNFAGKTESGQIMHDTIQQFYNLPKGPNSVIAEELLFLDLTRIVNGFDYERVNQESNTANTLSEYLEFGAVTFNLRVLLDIDIALYPYNMDPSIIGKLREAYKWSELALKLSSDIATFEREFFIEKSNNAVILYGQETGVLPKDVLRSNQEYKEQLFETVIPPLMKDVENKGKEYLCKSLESLKKINEIDITHISAAFKTLFENYVGQKTFSAPRKEVIP